MVDVKWDAIAWHANPWICFLASEYGLDYPSLHKKISDFDWSLKDAMDKIALKKFNCSHSNQEK
jgi:hypothetical protein